jgi:hypothetical protein
LTFNIIYGLTFFIENSENKELKGVSVRFASKFFDVKQTVDIKPLGKTEIIVPVDKEKLYYETF